MGTRVYSFSFKLKNTQANTDQKEAQLASTMYLPRFIALFLAASQLAASDEARGSFDVSACGAAGANHSWSGRRSAPNTHLTIAESCRSGKPDPYGSMEHGIGVLDVLWGEAVPPGGELRGTDGLAAEIRFDAPAGTRISRAVIAREVGHAYDAWTSYGRVDGVDQPSESCQPTIDEVICRRTGSIEFGVLDAGSMSYGVRCLTARPECRVGATLHHAWALVLEARVTLEDLEAPVVSGVEGVGLADGGWHRSGGSLFFSASDNTGVRERRVVEGSVVRGVAQAPSAAAGGCAGTGGVAYTYTEPCAGTRGINGRQAVSISSPCSWGDGQHTLRGAATDTGGGTSYTAPVVVRVDCSAPVVSVTAGSNGEALAGSELAPVVQAADAASGVSATTVEVEIDGATWQPYGGPTPVAEGRTYRFRARASDLAGNVGPWVYSTIVRGVTAPPIDSGTAPPATDDTPKPSALEVQRPSAPRSGAEQPPAPPTAGASEAPGPPAPAPVDQLARKPRDAGLRVLSTKATRRSLRLSGTVTPAYTGVVTVRLTAGGRSVTKRARVRRGRWAVTIERPARGRAHLSLATTAGAFAPARVRLTLR
jgi:hypothetical protein